MYQSERQKFFVFLTEAFHFNNKNFVSQALIGDKPNLKTNKKPKCNQFLSTTSRLLMFLIKIYYISVFCVFLSLAH